MWVVQFKGKEDPGRWWELRCMLFESEELAVAQMAAEIFEDPSYKYRVREVPDVGG